MPGARARRARRRGQRRRFGDPHARGERDAERGGAGGQAARLGARRELQQLVEQRRADGAFLLARELGEALGRGEQRHGGRGGRSRQGHPAARRHRQPARRRDRHGDDVPAVVLELALGDAPAHALGIGHGARGRAVQHEHARVEHAREPGDHRRARLRLAQRVDQVALDRGQPLVAVQVARQRRPGHVARDVAERRLQRHREHREGPLARLLQQRARHALEHEPQPDAQRADPRGVQLGDQRALRRRAPAQPHPGREHHPVALEEPGRRLDVDRVRARHLARQRVGAAGDERQAEILGG